MERKESSRHLVAILFTDIVGYTSMMQMDEHLALTAVRKHQETLERLIPLHHGEIYQFLGDGSLCIFNSATQAVECALEIQKDLLVEPAVLIRMGIHIGEIYTEGGKIFGDGVNIASRIESIGQGGTVLFSRDVFEKVRNHTAYQIQSIGKYEFKNVHEPVEVFALMNPGLKTFDLTSVDGKLKIHKKQRRWSAQYIMSAVILILVAGYFLALRPVLEGSKSLDLDENKSIAVLPFKNLSDETEADFLSIGIAEDILTQLAQIKGLKVISRSSSIRYKGSDKSIKSIAKELGVNSILEGSVRKYDKNLRVSVQLTDGRTESLIWAADFDRQFEDVLNVQRNVALAVSEKLKVALSPQLRNRLQGKINVNPEAYVNYQMGKDVLSRSSGTKEDMQKAISYFELSISHDSTFANAWAGLGGAYLESIYWHRIPTDEGLIKAKYAISKALALDSELGEAYGILGAINYVEKNLAEGEMNLRKAIALSPNYSFAYERLSWILVMLGRETEAFELFDRIIQLDPLSSRNKGSICNTYAVLENMMKAFN